MFAVITKFHASDNFCRTKNMAYEPLKPQPSFCSNSGGRGLVGREGQAALMGPKKLKEERVKFQGWSTGATLT